MRLIDADDLRKKMMYVCDESGRVIDRAPTVDPVKHGKWIGRDRMRYAECSVCKSIEATYNIQYFAYCPYCGAKMDLI